jgi:serine/threonine-protein kinase
MGSVFRAEDVELSRPVALKRLHAGTDGAARRRLVREARAAAQLQHPNVIAVYEVSDTGGAPFIAMELVDGSTLTAWLRGQRSWREIVAVLQQAGPAVVPKDRP